MDTLAGWLARLRIAGNDDLMLECLDQDLILVAFLIDVAYRILGERACRDQTLLGAGDREVCGCWHDGFPCLTDKFAPRGAVAGWALLTNKKCAGFQSA